MPYTLALCLDAPMQSWGVRSRFTSRDTAREPTKSGVVGVVAAALGIDRDDDEKIQALAQLEIGVRVDREGLLERDYHTVSNVPNTEGKNHRTVVSHRYYLADALFLVAVQSEHHDTLFRIHAALNQPHWPVYLGRKAFVPARPLVGPSPDDSYLGVAEGRVEGVLESHVWLENSKKECDKAVRDLRDGNARRLRTLVDGRPTDARAEPRHDVPVSFRSRDRRFYTRSVCRGEVVLTESMIAGEQSCI
ncbi:type I-E CRISPR-associated protein Cas5/CasD [Actinobacteria bacterium YIM 96077]|uniref:Type I-E CRISPR-associated protein Cas5/CasD n=1 Tax=Phytoactinopolyspora halophila TaxID=1981511 RepID=A0A329QE44_9ACTN|nr:type I-E CRISPR-associated protein Cas5/CasD [Phytoactinopolyspora halophila]AYY15541.1 type I-E CRISPR-associated protein Cas5/CasD [Actinobacteria bacterium YIM 96077]RAW09482.1 type I-E CRISPR-associated protein Cas5/CasD [Phytoactinopolyspora halophila]